MRLLLFVLTLLVSIQQTIYGQDILIHTQQSTKIDDNCSYFFDSSKTHTIEWITKEVHWRPSQEISSRYIITNDAIWLKTSIINTTGEPIYCRIDNPRLDSVDIYIEPKNGSVYHYNAIGNSFPITNRAFYSNSLISNLPKDTSFTIYFRLTSPKKINFPLFIGTASTMLNFIFINTMLDSIYFGAALIILLYNFFIYLSLKDKASAYYFISTFFMVIFMTFWKGYQAFFTPFFKSFLFHYSNLFAVSTIFFLILFSVHFLKIKKLSLLLYRYYMLLAISLMGILLLTFTNNSAILGNVFYLIVILSMISLVAGSIYAVIKKIIVARLYLLGFFINVICIVIFILPLAGIKSYSPLYSHIVPLGSILETICLSIALSQNLISLKKEKEIILLKTLIEEEKLRKKTEELKESDRKMADYKLMALRSVMNPHFLFNSLNSIQFYISKNDKLNALNYLSKFSQLIRSVLNSSIENSWPLSEEIKLLTNFIALEKLRLDDNLQVNFHIDPQIDPDELIVPSLILQPYVENAIEHGLLNKESNRILTINLAIENDFLICHIEDNGIGREASKKIKSDLNKHKSIAMGITEERLKLISKDTFLSLNVIDLYDQQDNGCGTRVEIKISIVS